MQISGKLFTGLVVLVALALGGVAQAAVLSVDPTYGDTPGAGQFRKISEALAAAQSSDTIQVAAGDYAEALSITKGVTLQGSGPQFTRQNATITIKTTEPVKISGFTVTSAGDGLFITSPSSAMDISNNCIVGNGGYGVNLAVSSGTTSYTLTLINNTVSYNGNAGIWTSISASGIAPTVNLVNNIFSNNGSFGVFLWDTKGYSISGNDIYANNGNNSFSCGSQKDYCRVGVLIDNLNVDPLFASPAQGDFTLLPSPLVRLRGKVGASYLNPDGTQNDIGAYGGPGAASFWPYGYGPVVSGMSAAPVRVTQGGTITIKATATVR